MVTAATRQYYYLLPSVEASKGCKVDMHDTWLSISLLSPMSYSASCSFHRQGNSCLWLDVKIDGVRATWDEWLNPAATLGMRFPTL